MIDSRIVYEGRVRQPNLESARAAAYCGRTSSRTLNSMSLQHGMPINITVDIIMNSDPISVP